MTITIGKTQTIGKPTPVTRATQVLARNPHTGKLLLGVARLLVRMPEQKKLLKVGRLLGS